MSSKTENYHRNICYTDLVTIGFGLRCYRHQQENHQEKTEGKNGCFGIHL